MNKPLRTLALLASLVLAGAAQAQVPPQGNADQESMLAAADAHVAANKRLVYDFWREVFEGGHLEFADKYLAEGYIQHNPNVPTGRAAFVTFFGRFVKPKPVAARINAPLVAVVGEGDMVVLAFARENPDPKDPTRKYATTWFDMFRLEGGKIAEHWDPALKQ
ncbi:nuclear transport factor 2 family protein [Ramlibacter sp.]|uniref:nuclear transport factor 2 family protein n=1 Tax=Ramlibacter sp. TaxID=1917967 RepID=UPI00261BAFAA|nr:nuclear transport factor 2 family protein [Ramlibacter sp.]MDB5956871.1 putative SnoaL-like aldol condensation-catalyzing enzyme [Ramlibacter sp.]